MKPAANVMRWLARGEPQLPRDDGWLSPVETARAATMRFTKRRTEFLVARWTAKQAIAGYLQRDIHPARIEVRHHITGAPEAYLDGKPLDIGISLTDRADWAVCLLGGAPGAVGCDLELVEPRSAAFVRHFFTSTEQQAIHDDLTANLLWSAKESVLKVLRTGLRRDTRTVEVVAEPGGAEWTSLTACTIEGTIYPGWWRRIGDFILTVAADHPAPAPKPLEQPSTLASATPRHSWLAQPVTRPSCGQVMPSVVGAGRPEFGRAPGPAR